MDENKVIHDAIRALKVRSNFLKTYEKLPQLFRKFASIVLRTLVLPPLQLLAKLQGRLGLTGIGLFLITIILIICISAISNGMGAYVNEEIFVVATLLIMLSGVLIGVDGLIGLSRDAVSSFIEPDYYYIQKAIKEIESEKVVARKFQLSNPPERTVKTILEKVIRYREIAHDRILFFFTSLSVSLGLFGIYLAVNPNKYDGIDIVLTYSMYLSAPIIGSILGGALNNERLYKVRRMYGMN